MSFVSERRERLVRPRARGHKFNIKTVCAPPPGDRQTDPVLAGPVLPAGMGTLWVPCGVSQPRLTCEAPAGGGSMEQWQDVPLADRQADRD